MERKGKNEIQRMDEFVPIKMPRSRVTPEVSVDPGENHSPFLLIKLHRDLTKVSIKRSSFVVEVQLFFAQLCRLRFTFSVTFGMLQVLQAIPRVLGVNFMGIIA